MKERRARESFDTVKKKLKAKCDETPPITNFESIDG